MPARPLHAFPAAGANPVGGQAVMEGVMMRNGNACAVAMRRADGTIVAERLEWFSLGGGWLRKPFVRGFPILVETLINGIRALNMSAAQCAGGGGERLGPWQIALTLLAAAGMAVGLFVVLPHLLSLGMQWLGLGGGMEGVSFHLWDGLFKFAVFAGYIIAISFIPDIRRVFQYHGAEHKVIRAFESGEAVCAGTARRFSRLHPRCGTTFLLFVLSLAIILHTLTVPLLLYVWTPGSDVVRHAGILAFKLLLLIPISSLAYELIRLAAGLEDTFAGAVLRAPGMFLQLLTTGEPDTQQLEVAVVSLAVALGPDAPATMTVPTHARPD
jgi:uncharacterized protein YqhQ